MLAAQDHGFEAIEEALRTFDGGVLADRAATLADGDADALPAALRRLAATAGADGDRLVLHATRVAGRRNGRDLVPTLADDPRYHADRNAKTPRRIASTLGLYDCIMVAIRA